MGIFDIILWPFSMIIRFFYNLTGNYGIALILFTIVLRIILSPFAVKQQKGMIKSLKFKPRMDEIKEKYGKDKQRYQQELMKLQQEGYNPMSGCGPQLIQMPLLLIIYQIVAKPLTYTFGFTAVHLEGVFNKLKELGVEKFVNAATVNKVQEIDIIKAIPQYPDHLAGLMPVSPDQIRFDFLGIDLTRVLGLQWSSLLTIAVLLPIISTITSLLLSHVSRKMNPMTAAQEQPGGMNAMLYILPLFSGVMAFIFPLGLVLYWIMTNVTTLTQTYIINYFYNPKKKLAEIQAEEEKKKQFKKDKKKRKYLYKDQ